MNTKQKNWALFTAAVLLITLFFGLRPKGFRFVNNVEWLKGSDGIRFGRYGIAYANLDEDFAKGFLSPKGSFSIELAIRPDFFHKKRFGFILSVFAGGKQEQLLLGQWLSDLIIMNGDDYSHKRKTKRLTVKIDQNESNKILLTITSSRAAGTTVYINGQRRKAEEDFFLKMPQNNHCRLILGGSVYGNKSWQGRIYGLAFYEHLLAPAEVAAHYVEWQGRKDFSFAKKAKPALLYLFDEGGGRKAIDHAEGKQPLLIPWLMPILKKSFFSNPVKDFNRGKSKGYWLDVVINLLGFIPLGFCLVAFLGEFCEAARGKAIIYTVLVCFGISFGIEFVQAWMPSRDSQTSDLILNTFGGFLGGLLRAKLEGIKRKPRWLGT